MRNYARISNICKQINNKRLLPPPPLPLLLGASTVLAFAESYDWFRGAQHEQMYRQIKLCLHTLTPNQVQPKKTGGHKSGNRRRNNRRR